MHAERIKPAEFTEILKEIEMTSSLHIVPYTWIRDPETDESKCFVLTLQEITEFIRPFRAETKPNEDVGKCVARTLREHTFGLIDIKEKKFVHRMNVHLYVDEDYEGNPMIASDKIPIVTVNLKLETRQELDELIATYVQRLKNKLLMEPTSRGLATNLVYMTDSELYYLARGTTYSVIDGEEEYEYPVSKGIFFEKEIVDIYTPNRAAGEVPLTIIPNSDANSPFQSIVFSKISSEFAVTVFDVMSLEDEAVAIFY